MKSGVVGKGEIVNLLATYSYPFFKRKTFKPPPLFFFFFFFSCSCLLITVCAFDCWATRTGGLVREPSYRHGLLS